MEFPERTYLVNDKATKMYAFTLDSVDRQQKPVNKDHCSGEKPEELGSGAIYHCHGNAKATENRANEQVYAKWKLWAASGICFVFMIAEVVVQEAINSRWEDYPSAKALCWEDEAATLLGVLLSSQTLAHLLIDLTGFLLSLFSLWLSSKPPSKRLTFGWHRADVKVIHERFVCGRLCACILRDPRCPAVHAVCLGSDWCAGLPGCERLLYPDYQIQATVMIIVSGCAVAANIVLSVILHQRPPGHSHKEVQANASVRAAFVHALGDLLQRSPDYKMADSICTFVFSVLVLASTVTVLKDFSIVLMEGVPKNLNYNAVKELILAVDGVVSVHSLHIWSLTTNQVILSAHVAAASSRDSQGVQRDIAKALSNSFPVHSLTIQMESPPTRTPAAFSVKSLRTSSVRPSAS
ncbi:hypothetical protein QTO34_007674 [Cnephaeus nilssonii]|uniref:Proton-coupled zinc antiporter SLC30A8 n=1 Tax=Cnephaeus nilssonii TaxID=3371016 RepID=A0AA40LH29_CNENI|nr:hypothetical protein QTO34_007674 [Eptesicus nilssonii]